MTNDEIRNRIDQYIHKEHYRRILKRKLVDGITYEALAEEVDMSPRGTSSSGFTALASASANSLSSRH